MRSSLVLVSALLLLACGSGDPAPAKKRGAKKSPGRFQQEVVELPEAHIHLRDPVDAPPPALTLRTRLKGRRFEIGSPIHVTLVLRNWARYPVRLYAPKKSLGKDLRYRILRPDGTKIVLETRLDADEKSILPYQVEEVEKDREFSTAVDIAPILADAGRGAPGTYEVSISYTGGYQGKHLDLDIWNRTGMREVRARPFEVRLVRPDLPVGEEGPPAREFDITEMLGELGPAGELSAEARERIIALGARAYPALTRKLVLATSPDEDEQAVAWAAFEILKGGGRAALVALDDFGGEGAMEDLLRRWLDADVATPGVLRPAGADFSDELFDPRRRDGVVFRLTRHAGRDQFIVTLHGDGLVDAERHEMGEVLTARARLDPRHLDRLFKLFVRERFWVHRGVRREGLKGEDRIVLEQLRVEKEGVRYVERPVRRIEAWGRETVLNRSLGTIVRALEAVRPSK